MKLSSLCSKLHTPAALAWFVLSVEIWYWFFSPLSPLSLFHSLSFSVPLALSHQCPCHIYVRYWLSKCWATHSSACVRRATLTPSVQTEKAWGGWRQTSVRTQKLRTVCLPCVLCLGAYACASGQTYKKTCLYLEITVCVSVGGLAAVWMFSLKPLHFWDWISAWVQLTAVLRILRSAVLFPQNSLSLSLWHFFTLMLAHLLSMLSWTSRLHRSVSN